MSQFPPQPPLPPPTTLGYETPLPPQNPGMAIASLVLGILSLVCACAPMINVLTPVLAILALVFGALAFRRTRGTPVGGGGKGMALAGMICGGINLIIFAGMAAYLFLAVARTPATIVAPPPVVPAPATTPTTVPAQ